MMTRAIAIPSRLENAAFVLTILAVAGGLAAFEPNGQVLDRPQTEVASISEAGDAVKQIVLGLFYLLNVMLLARFIRPWAWRFLGLPLMALTALCFCSIAWSVIPDGTLRRTAALAGPLIVGLYAGLRYDEDRLTRALAVAAAVAATGSLFWAAAFKANAFDADGHLRGLFYHKNAFGSFLALSMVAVIYRVVVLRRFCLQNAGLLAMLLGCIALSHSATPIVATTAAFLVLSVVIALQHSKGLLAPILIGAFCVVLVAFLFFGSQIADLVAEVLGRDQTLSGRTAIWHFIIPMIQDRLWLGYGYGIFWLGDTAPGALFWYWSKQFELHAHDGFLQLLLDTGLVGLALFLTSLGTTIVRAARLSRAGTVTLVRWVAAFLGYYLVCNITDTELWQANSLLTILFVWVVTRVNMATWRESTLRMVVPRPMLLRSVNMNVQAPLRTGRLGAIK